MSQIVSWDDHWAPAEQGWLFPQPCAAVEKGTRLGCLTRWVQEVRASLHTWGSLFWGVSVFCPPLIGSIVVDCCIVLLRIFCLFVFKKIQELLQFLVQAFPR